MELLLLIAFFVALVGVIVYVGYRHYARPAGYYEQLGNEGAHQAGTLEAVGDGQPNVAVRLIRQVGEQVPISPSDVALTRRYLIAAGYRTESAVRILYGAKVLSTLVLLAVAFWLRNYVPLSPVFRLVFVGLGAAVGYTIPGMILEHLVNKRQDDIKYALPDALDLMTVCVEAGLGLDQAILRVSNELRTTHHAISEELGMVTLEMQAGKRRSDALRNLGERTGEAELRKLVAILIQTDRFGTSMAESLRTHSDFLRVRRRQEAEERANKVGVKLVFPIFFCILPAMLIVVAGPGMLQIIKHLFPMMRQFSAGQGL